MTIGDVHEPLAPGTVSSPVAPIGVAGDGTVSPHEPPSGAAAPVSRLRSVDWKLVGAALSGLIGSLLITGSAPIHRFAVFHAYPKIPFVPRPPRTENTAWNDLASIMQLSLFLVGMVLMCLGWLGLVRRADRMAGSERRRLRTVLAVAVLWTLPVLVGPPLLSNDSYSYAAQGEMSAQGLDPTHEGPAVGLGRGDFLQQVDPFWRTAPAPYGPVWVLAGEGVVIAAGHSPVASVWLFRAVALLGVAIATVGLVSLARSHRVPVPIAVAVGIANPLVVLHLVGGEHNDALMMGFLVCGVAAAKKGRRWLAVLLLTFATAIKLPAFIALAILAWQFEGVRVPLRRRIVGLVKVGGVAAAMIGALCVVAGIGLGWVSALKSTGKVMDTMSVTTLLGYSITDLAHLVRLQVGFETPVNIVRMIGVLAGAALSFKLLIQSGKVGLARAIGLCMIIMVLFGPVVWPWYLPAGFALIAGSGLGKWRPSYLIGCLLASWLVWPNNIVAHPFLVDNQRNLMLGVCIATTLACWIAQRHAATHGRYLADEEALAAQG